MPGGGACWHTQCTSIARLALTRARAAKAQSKPFRLSPGLPTSSTEGRLCCCCHGGCAPCCCRCCAACCCCCHGGFASCCCCCWAARGAAEAGAEPGPVHTPATACAPPQPHAPGAAPPSTAVGAASAAAAHGPGQKRCESTPLCMSTADRPNSCLQMDWTHSAAAATACKGKHCGRTSAKASKGTAPVQHAACTGQQALGHACAARPGSGHPSRTHPTPPPGPQAGAWPRGRAAGRRGGAAAAGRASGVCTPAAVPPGQPAASAAVHPISQLASGRQAAERALRPSRQPCGPAALQEHVPGPAPRRCRPPGSAAGRQTATRGPAQSTARVRWCPAATRAPARGGQGAGAKVG